ncbi:MAG TPA: ABC transporter substrate-binding protein [Tepidisphaeraceae bacterium]|nr:ABC transporter substrate-binding protein [Tepidisphaeraceae bacterium]
MHILLEEPVNNREREVHHPSFGDRWTWVVLRWALLPVAGLVAVSVMVLAMGLLLSAMATSSSDPSSPAASLEIGDGNKGKTATRADLVARQSAAASPAEKDPPLLSPLVAAGQLPPLPERLPVDPRVMNGADSPGRYGGTWLRLATGESDVAVIENRLSMATPLRWTPIGDDLVPHVCSQVDELDGGRTFVLHLRPGHKWSDGAPFTTADAMYWWEHEINDAGLGGGQAPDWLVHAGQTATLEAPDTTRLRIRFATPNGPFRQRLASIFAYELFSAPAHYLRPLHPTLGDQALIARAMRDASVASPLSLYKSLKRWSNPAHPRLWPWVYRTFSSSAPHVFVRNPFYFAVDAHGRQLPYLDRVQFDVRSGELLTLSASEGGASMQARHLRFDKFTDLMTQRDAGDYDVYQWQSAAGSSWVINPNLNRATPEGDPAAADKARLLAEADFRRALSVAIDRKRIVRAEYVDRVRPAQVAPPVGSPFYDAALQSANTQYDPSAAEAMLDALGFVRPRPGAMRQLDGRALTFFLDYSAFTGPGPVQFVVDDWAAVGVRAIPRERARSLFMMGRDARTSDLLIWTGESEARPLLSPRSFVPFGTESFWAVGWGKWFAGGGLRDDVAARAAGGVRPPDGHPALEAMRLYEAALSATEEVQRRELFGRLAAIAAENVWTISVAESPPQLVVVDRDLRNVPRQATDGVIFGSPGHTGMETFYFATKYDSTGATEAARASVLYMSDAAVARRAGSAEPAAGSSGRWWVLGTLAVLGAVGARYPFIGRRVLIMVPTLAVLSVAIFTIIQLPPGDFLTTQLAQLEASGDPTADRQIAELKQAFHFDDSLLSRYCRWVGLTWFTSFDATDAGLLQGDLGRSMQTGRPVNEMVGDRLTLTLGITLGTIALTWLIALPVGIYSAVRQYTAGDYAVTLVSFLGMCVPPFLLALILMAVTGTSGLFSPEYVAQPDWTAGKLLDLLKHLWIPVLVLALDGTGGMIRVMRANMLDELRKPYVTTARAKGMRPMRLVLRYPMRLALNPFISRVGNLFPQLISGGAIVAIVLSLPTVGPLMLEALLNQDMYLAGSLLMVLSVLGIVGTLVSDLLLVALDPRIRFGGGTR